MPITIATQTAETAHERARRAKVGSTRPLAADSSRPTGNISANDSRGRMSILSAILQRDHALVEREVAALGRLGQQEDAEVRAEPVDEEQDVDEFPDVDVGDQPALPLVPCAGHLDGAVRRRSFHSVQQRAIVRRAQLPPEAGRVTALTHTRGTSGDARSNYRLGQVHAAGRPDQRRPRHPPRHQRRVDRQPHRHQGTAHIARQSRGTGLRGRDARARLPPASIRPTSS